VCNASAHGLPEYWRLLIVERVFVSCGRNRIASFSIVWDVLEFVFDSTTPGSAVVVDFLSARLDLHSFLPLFVTAAIIISSGPVEAGGVLGAKVRLVLGSFGQSILCRAF
jgi:hypothetical protein